MEDELPKRRISFEDVTGLYRGEQMNQGQVNDTGCTTKHES